MSIDRFFMTGHGFQPVQRSPQWFIAVSLFAMAALAAGPIQAATCHVDADATGANHDGTSWPTAYTDLQTALSDPVNCTEVWVAEGTYHPVTPADPVIVTDIERKIWFAIAPAMKVYGGFDPNTGDVVFGDRDPVVNVTILSGDIVGDDDSNNADGNGISETAAEIVGSNSYHVVLLDGAEGNLITANTRLDGFTITGGNANGASDYYAGGGLYCYGGNTGNECSPSLSNLVFSGNSANRVGGAIYNNGNIGGISSPALSNVIFSGNSAAVYGGAMLNGGNTGGISSPTLSNVTFSNNTAGYGGAMFNGGLNGNSSPVLSNVTFSGNSAFGGGAIFNNGNGSPSLTNVTFSDNTATAAGASLYVGGGAMFNDADGGIVSPTLVNVTFSGNVSIATGGAIRSLGENGGNVSLTLHNVILWDSFAETGGNQIYNHNVTPPTINYSIVEGGNAGISNFDGTAAIAFSAGSENLDADPVLQSLADYGGSTRTMRPGAADAAIDTGTCTDAPVTDQRGVARPYGSSCDIGAFEWVNEVFDAGFEP